MDRPGSYRALRTTAAFFAAVGAVLALVVAGVVLRELIAPPDDTWSAWTRGAVFVTSLIAIAFSVVGGLLSFRLHRVHRDAVRTFLSGADRDRIASSIRDAEAKSSGEIVVHVVDRTQHMPTVDAKKAFEKIGMTRTRDRTGVLFFVSVSDHKLAVIGDKGINDRVPPDFWARVIKHVEGRFGEARFGDGLAEGIEMVGTELSRFFPRRVDDVNELPDTMSREDR